MAVSRPEYAQTVDCNMNVLNKLSNCVFGGQDENMHKRY